MLNKLIVIFIACLFLSPLEASAQFGKIGDKILREGNIEAAKKLGKAAILSDADMQALSLQSVRYMDEHNPIAYPGDPYADRLKVLVDGLESEEGLKLNFKVYKVRNINAFATPDGSIRIMAGLMQLMNDEELMSIVGHEIGHVKLKHTKKQYQKAYALSAARDAAQANTGSAAVLAEGEIGTFVENVMNAKFSRNDESKADAYGFNFVLKHGYDHHAMASAFQKLAALTGGDGKQSLSATHPHPSERAKRAAGWAAAEDKKHPPPPKEEPVPAPEAAPAPAVVPPESDAPKNEPAEGEPAESEPAEDAPADAPTEDGPSDADKPADEGNPKQS